MSGEGKKYALMVNDEKYKYMKYKVTWLIQKNKPGRDQTQTRDNNKYNIPLHYITPMQLART